MEQLFGGSINSISFIWNYIAALPITDDLNLTFNFGKTCRKFIADRTPILSLGILVMDSFLHKTHTDRGQNNRTIQLQFISHLPNKLVQLFRNLFKLYVIYVLVGDGFLPFQLGWIRNLCTFQVHFINSHSGRRLSFLLESLFFLLWVLESCSTCDPYTRTLPW